MEQVAQSGSRQDSGAPAVHLVDAPYYLVAHLTHPDHEIETLSAHFSERADALIVARLLRCAGWETTVRGWRPDQRIDGHTEDGRPIWGAGYVEVRS